MSLQSEDMRRATRQAVTYTVLVVAITAFLIMLRVWGVGGDESGALRMAPDGVNTPKSVTDPAPRPLTEPAPRMPRPTPTKTDRQDPGTDGDSGRTTLAST